MKVPGKIWFWPFWPFLVKNILHVVTLVRDLDCLSRKSRWKLDFCSLCRGFLSESWQKSRILKKQVKIAVIGQKNFSQNPLALGKIWYENKHFYESYGQKTWFFKNRTFGRFTLIPLLVNLKKTNPSEMILSVSNAKQVYNRPNNNKQ